MTHLDPKSTSLDIAQHTREQAARDAMGHYADLRNGGLIEEPRPSYIGRAIIAGVVFGLVSFCVGYHALGDVPDVPAETFTNRYSTGC